MYLMMIVRMRTASRTHHRPSQQLQQRRSIYYTYFKMDIAQIFGDYIQLLGMIILLVKLLLTKNCAGISGKTQLLYALVFTARYADLTIGYISLYNTILKTAYICIICCTCLSIFLFFRKTYDRKLDAFRIELLILPCCVFALFLNHAFETIEVFTAFSLYLESVAIVPQVYFVSKAKQVESIVVSYVACLGLYRGCYLMHWAYMYFKQQQLEEIAIASSIVQLIFYCDFFARNLPILKPKHHHHHHHHHHRSVVRDDITTTTTTSDNNLALGKIESVGSKEDMPDGLLIVDCKNNQQLVDMTSTSSPANPVAKEDRVTLLTSKEQGTSN